MTPAILTRRQAAAYLAVSAGTMKAWYFRRVGPKCLKRGEAQSSRAVYRVTDLEEWVAAGCPMDTWPASPATKPNTPAVAGKTITPSVTGQTPEKKRPAGGANRPRAKKLLLPPLEGGNDGPGYPRPPGRRSRACGPRGKAPAGAGPTDSPGGVADHSRRPPKVGTRPANR